jgi:proteasome assembly chaperone (PAC2) family protein
MNVSKKGAMKVGRDLFEIYETLRLQNPFLIVGWQTQDVGKLGSRVIDFLIEKVGGHEIAGMKPLGFFHFGGIRFKEDLVQVPEGKFWVCEKHNLLIFKSDEPEFEHYKFLNAVLDFAGDGGQAKELYTLNGTLSLIAHTQPRKILTVYNQSEIKEKLQNFGLIEMTWEGPPAISSYLLWVAKRRGIPGVSLWPEIPFYLATGEDLQAIKRILFFLNERFHLDLDSGELDNEIRDQNEKIAQLRRDDAEIDQLITQLESGLKLNEEEQLKLAQGVYEVLKK